MSYTLLAEHARKARKEHRCIWCPENIIPGDTFLDERSVYYGEFQHHHWHPECRTAADKWFCEMGEEEFAPHFFKRGTAEEN